MTGPASSTFALGLMEVVLRSMTHDDIPELNVLLTDLPSDYPGGDIWLARRLRDVLVADATCTVAVRDDRLVGAVIGTPKSSGTKLSTIYVSPRNRASGVGGALLDRFLASDVRTPSGHPPSEVYVTVAHHKWALLSPLLTSRGFSQTALELNRYGPGRHEFVATRLR